MARNADPYTQIGGVNEGMSRKFAEAFAFRDFGKSGVSVRCPRPARPFRLVTPRRYRCKSDDVLISFETEATTC
jgi:hypothetical protein